MDEITKETPRFLVIGCGGAGNLIVDKMATACLPSVKTIAIDTDKRDLDFTHADRKILLGNGLYKGLREGNPDESAKAVNEAREEIDALIQPEDVVFIVAGLGGGAGSGGTPQVAKIAREKGALVIAIISLPFQIQQRWIKQSRESLVQLRQYTDSVIVIDNEQFRWRYHNEPVPLAYEKADEIILGVIRGLVTVVTLPCLIESNMEDLRVLFRNRGFAIVLDGEAGSTVRNMNESVVRKCLESRSWDVDYRKASGCFILITGGYDMDLIDFEDISTSLTYEMDPHADIVWSAIAEKPMEGRVRVYAIVTGVKTVRERG
ncbi:MAG: cell division protein FtsZ [Methanoregula sp.]|nr:cell division protein FtsZ [Methanoregula sp.]